MSQSQLPTKISPLEINVTIPNKIIKSNVTTYREYGNNILRFIKDKVERLIEEANQKFRAKYIDKAKKDLLSSFAPVEKELTELKTAIENESTTHQRIMLELYQKAKAELIRNEAAMNEYETALATIKQKLPEDLFDTYDLKIVSPESSLCSSKEFNAYPRIYADSLHGTSLEKMLVNSAIAKQIKTYGIKDESMQHLTNLHTQIMQLRTNFEDALILDPEKLQVTFNHLLEIRNSLMATDSIDIMPDDIDD